MSAARPAWMGWLRSSGTAYAIAAAALGTRLIKAASQSWYPDEGNFVELAQSLWRGGPGAIGAVKQTALLPAACSHLAPLMAAPWAGLAGEAISGVRIWSAILGALACFGLVRLGQRYQRPWLGLGAGLAMALWALPVHLGAWALYHHLGVLGVVACALSAARFQAAPTRAHWLQLCTLAGLTLAAAYWTFWLLCLPLALAWFPRRRAWLWMGLLCLGLPLGLDLLFTYAAQPASLLFDLKTVAAISSGTFPFWLRCIAPLYGFYRAAQAFPPLILGLAGLGLLLAQGWRAKRWPPISVAALALLLGGVDVFRQRQNLEAFPYPLILVLPAFCLGLGALLEDAIRAAAQGSSRWVPWAFFGLGVFVPQPHFDYMEALSAPPAQARALLAKAGQTLQAGDLVLGQSALNWGLPRGVRACQWEDVAVAQGQPTNTYSAPLPPERLRFVPRLEQARWLIVSPYTYSYTFGQASVRAIALRAEQLGFRLAWSSGAYTVFERRTAAGPLQTGRILEQERLYDLAAQEALARGDLPGARFAQGQARGAKGP